MLYLSQTCGVHMNRNHMFDCKWQRTLLVEKENMPPSKKQCICLLLKKKNKDMNGARFGVVSEEA